MQPSDSKSNSEPAKLSDATISKSLRTLAPRKLARLFNDAKQPFYILDGKDRVRYLNKALLEILQVEESCIIGLDCSHATTNEADQNSFANLLTLPASARRATIALIPIGTSEKFGSKWSAKLLISLDSEFGNGSIGCWWLNHVDPLVRELATRKNWLASSEIQTAISQARQSFPKLEGLYMLIGNSPGSSLARRKAKAAIESPISFCISGPRGSGKSTLAQAILQHRGKRLHRNMTGSQVLPIECRLMDRGLMQEMLELAQERSTTVEHHQDQPEAPTLLLKNLDQLPAESHSLVANFIRRNSSWMVSATTSVDALWQLHPDSIDWRSILALVEVMSIRLVPLHQRIEDIAPTAIAILDDLQGAVAVRDRKYLSEASLRCLEGYAWPDELREMLHNLRETLLNVVQSSIEPSHFSLAIKTFASHVMKPEPIGGVQLDQILEDVERRIIQQAMFAYPRNRAEAARQLGISRTRLLRRLEELGLEAMTENVPTNQTMTSQGKSLPPEIAMAKKATTKNTTKKSEKPQAVPASKELDGETPVFVELQEDDLKHE
jgi:DNA-binding protein Fis